MTEAGVQCIVTPKTLRRVPDILEKVGGMCRAALIRHGAVIEMAGHDLTSWDFVFVPEHFDPDIGKVIPDAFHINAIAPMPDAIQVQDLEDFRCLKRP